ncbi:MAG: histidine phosphatase family protein, partial [Chloroflexi bacterium]|nr:histidine phosphatase family protein [Chloroflexota bacterium]
AQAAAAAAVLAGKPLAGIYSSPMLRARQTGQVILDRHPVLETLRVSKYLNEVHTPYDGQPLADLAKIDWEFYNDVVPPYETPEQIVERVRQFAQRILRQHPGEEVVAVTHGDIVCFTIAWAMRLSIDGEAKRQIAAGEPGYPATASITSFSFTDTDPQPAPDYHYIKPYA